MLLYLQDVFDFCGLSEQEIRALAKHEHISQVSAAALGSSLLESKEGIGEIERFMREDIEDAELHRQPVKVEGLERVFAQRKG